nr:hypothetical protein [Tanacetum cinerariifolium]
ADPSESLPPLVSVAPMVSPFLCSDDSESNTEMLKRHVSPTPYDAMLTRFVDDELFLSYWSIYCTHHGGPFMALTMRKSVRPLPSHRLALRYISHHLDRFGSSSGHSSSDHSSFGHSILGHSLSRHASPDTTIDDSSTPLRFVYPTLARTLQCSEAYLYWRPSRKRCMSPAAIVTASTHATRALVLSCVDLLVRNKMHKAFPLPVMSSHFQKMFPLLARKLPLAMIKRSHCREDCTANEDKA